MKFVTVKLPASDVKFIVSLLRDRHRRATAALSAYARRHGKPFSPAPGSLDRNEFSRSRAVNVEAILCAAIGVGPALAGVPAPAERRLVCWGCRGQVQGTAAQFDRLAWACPACGLDFRQGRYGVEELPPIPRGLGAATPPVPLIRLGDPSVVVTDPDEAKNQADKAWPWEQAGEQAGAT